MKQILSVTWNCIRFHKGSLLRFELLFKSIFFTLFLTFFSLGFRLSLYLSGYRYLTFENLRNFLVRPVTIIFMLLTLLICAFFASVELISLTMYYNKRIRERKVSLATLFFPGLRHCLKILKNPKNFLLLFLGLLQWLCITLPLVLAAYFQSQLPYVLSKLPVEQKLLIVLGVVLVAFFYITYFCGLFTLQICVMEGKTLIPAYRESVRVVKKNLCLLLSSIVIWNVVLVVFFLFLYLLVMFGVLGFIYVTVKPSLVVPSFLIAFQRINIYTGIFVSIISIIVNICFFVVIFFKIRTEERPLARYVGKDSFLFWSKRNHTLTMRKERNLRRRQSKQQRVLLILCILIVTITTASVLNALYNGTVFTTSGLFGVNITCHRGCVKEAPENTLPAIEAAIDSLADYAEIDVRMTADERIILLHDTTFRRTCGVNKTPYSMNLEEVKKLDAGSSFSKDFAGTAVPTLEEVFELCKGHINLNIEVKYNANSPEIVPKVLSLIEEYDMENQCIISSTNYNAIKQVKELDDSIKTGLILSFTYGTLTGREAADFFSVNSRFITEDMVTALHSQGRELHAWTVNSKTEMERLKTIGVDNIITDQPLTAIEVFYRTERQENFLEMFREMLLR